MSEKKWDQPEREVTPESALLSRRRLLKRLGLGGVALGVGAGLWWWLDKGADHQVLAAGQTLADTRHYPASLNPRFKDIDRPMTTEPEAARYCNFYEFSNSKAVWRHIQSFEPIPWNLRVDGLVAKPRTFDLDDLLKVFSLEERIYRHRCVEAWAMVVPWTGFPLAALLRKVEPLPEARYVRFVSFDRPEQASRQGSRSMPWPYTEGLTLAEAGNELAFIATGMYGHPLLKQHGAPVRLVTPWKYGFKSAKSIVHIELTRKIPDTFWNTLAPEEYGFRANVNPTIPHPRWSQATERMLGTGEIRPTQMYNGYGDWVAGLYR
jgi:methionine sulfoxide reductase catalytic subunit